MIYFRSEVLTIYKHFRVNKDVIDDAIDMLVTMVVRLMI